MILAHDVAGAGPNLLLLHAGVADRRMWDLVVGSLAEHFRVLRCDLRGFGDSPLPAEPYTDADDLDVLLEAMGMPDAVVLGNSHGGAVALELATAHPERVRRLVLLSPAHDDGVAADAQLAAFEAREEELLEAGDVAGAVRLNVDTWLGPTADDSVRASLATMQRRAFDVQLAAEADALARGVEIGEPSDVAVRAQDITAPTVVITGDHDLAHFRGVADRLADTIPGAQRLRLDWAGHLPTLEDPVAAAALLVDVLRPELRTAAP